MTRHCRRYCVGMLIVGVGVGDAFAASIYGQHGGRVPAAPFGRPSRPLQQSFAHCRKAACVPQPTAVQRTTPAGQLSGTLARVIPALV
mmetsp:Transcript_37065/g.119459  ORF Transcript_37065/g.119459 Transcript_37065/m.119459 type:complete len:88 (-) Transcript_37065:1108-1371(-)